MCWMCDRYNTALTNDWDDASATVHFGNGSAKSTDALIGTGDVVDTRPLPTLIVVDDSVPGDTGTTATLTVNAPSTISTVDTVGDEDFYAVTLVAGQHYEIGMYGYATGPNLVPLSDAYVEIYDAEGNLIVSGDGGADTPLNAANSGFDVLLSFTAEESGTYYVNARAFDQEPTNGTSGDFIGDYELFVRDAAPGAYQPYYDVDSPLYAIDWGSQVDGTVRNPDGEESGHVTGNPEETPANPAGYTVAGKNVITIYFAQAGDVFTPADPLNPGLPPVLISTGTQEWEKETVFTALGEFSKVADVVYIEVDNREDANFIFTTYAGTPGPGVSLLGSMSPPGESDEGLAQFNSGDYRWTEENLQQGGFSYVTLIHEFGHGHGLAHPHDNGGRSGIMRGVESEGVVADYTTGDFALNQGVFTMMSYEDGWQTSPYGNAPTDVGYGYMGGLMAFDIAAIQDKYGVNEEWATGNNVYVLKDENAAGTYYTSIWDAGGTDSIVYAGSRVANIDLRAATLEYENGGGGWVSYAYGIFGGFTVANGVVIENATGGSGNDTLTGNDVANILNGGGGADQMTGGLGDDRYIVDNAGDAVTELSGQGTDEVRTGLGTYTLAANVENLRGTAAVGQKLYGNDLNNTIRGGDGADTLKGGLGNDLLVGGTGDMLHGNAGDDEFIVYDSNVGVIESGGQGTDRVIAYVSFTLGQNVENLSLSGTGNINGGGNALANSISGNAGANNIAGGLGSDWLSGGLGADSFYFDTGPSATNVDDILDFKVADDTIVLDRDVFTAIAVNGTLASAAFWTGAAAHDADDRIVYNAATGNIYYDADGNGAGAAQLFAHVTAGTALTNADFFAVI